LKSTLGAKLKEIQTATRSQMTAMASMSVVVFALGGALPFVPTSIVSTMLLPNKHSRTAI
jgi:hypothetical protein